MLGIHYSNLRQRQKPDVPANLVGSGAFTELLYELFKIKNYATKACCWDITPLHIDLKGCTVPTWVCILQVIHHLQAISCNRPSCFFIQDQKQVSVGASMSSRRRGRRSAQEISHPSLRRCDEPWLHTDGVRKCPTTSIVSRYIVVAAQANTRKHCIARLQCRVHLAPRSSDGSVLFKTTLQRREPT
jgi:hypothetical protein